MVLHEKEHVPQSQWAVLDALEAVRWCFVWVGFGDDEVVGNWTNVFVKQARRYPQSMDMVRSAYDAASWRVCMSMRTGATFQEATHEVRADTEWMREYLDTYKSRNPNWRSKGPGEANFGAGGFRPWGGRDAAAQNQGGQFRGNNQYQHNNQWQDNR